MMTVSQVELVETMIRMTEVEDHKHRMRWARSDNGPGLVAEFPKQETVSETKIVFLVNDLRLSVGRKLAPAIGGPAWVLLDISASDGTEERRLLGRLRDAVFGQIGGRSMEDLVVQTMRAIRGS